MSSLRRSTDHCRQVIGFYNRHQIRLFSSPPPALIASSIGSTDVNGTPKQSSLLKWISAVAVGAGVGVSVYMCSPSTDSTTYPVKSLMAFADWLTAAADRINKLYDNHPISSSNFLIRDSLRRRIFFNYEKRLRTLSPPEKAQLALILAWLWWIWISEDSYISQYDVPFHFHVVYGLEKKILTI